MRFMTIVKANRDSEAGVMPEEKLISNRVKRSIAFASWGPGSRSRHDIRCPFAYRLNCDLELQTSGSHNRKRPLT